MRTSVKKLFLTFTIALFLFPLALGAQTLSDLEIKIAALFAEIQTLQTELQTLEYNRGVFRFFCTLLHHHVGKGK